MFEGATELTGPGGQPLVPGFVLREDMDPKDGKHIAYVWHKIVANLSHPDVSPADLHKTACGSTIFGVAHASPSGHTNCAACGL